MDVITLLLWHIFITSSSIYSLLRPKREITAANRVHFAFCIRTYKTILYSLLLPILSMLFNMKVVIHQRCCTSCLDCVVQMISNIVFTQPAARPVESLSRYVCLSATVCETPFNTELNANQSIYVREMH